MRFERVLAKVASIALLPDVLQASVTTTRKLALVTGAFAVPKVIPVFLFRNTLSPLL